MSLGKQENHPGHDLCKGVDPAAPQSVPGMNPLNPVMIGRDTKRTETTKGLIIVITAVVKAKKVFWQEFIKQAAGREAEATPAADQGLGDKLMQDVSVTVVA